MKNLNPFNVKEELEYYESTKGVPASELDGELINKHLKSVAIKNLFQIVIGASIGFGIRYLINKKWNG